MGAGGRGAEEVSASRASALSSTGEKEGRQQGSRAAQSVVRAPPHHSLQQAASAAKHASSRSSSSVTEDEEAKGGITRPLASMHTSKVVGVKAAAVTEKQLEMSAKAASSACASSGAPGAMGSPQQLAAAASGAGDPAAASAGGETKSQQHSKGGKGGSAEESVANNGGGDDCQSLSTCTLTNRMDYRSRASSGGSSSSSEEGDEVPSLVASVLAIEVEAQKPSERKTSENSILWVFALVLLLEIFVNFDSGVVPAILPTLEKEFHLVGTTEGLLGALPYIGLGFSSPFVGRGLTLFSPKYFCFFTMLVNVLATGLFGLAAHKGMLFFARLLLGLTQAGFSIYAPVWVDRFAPRDKLTLWMGLTQGGVVIGTVFGCVTAGALDAARRSGMPGAHWRYALLIQFLWLLILVVAWGLTPRYLLEIDLNHVEEDSETSSVASVQGSEDNEQVTSGEDIASEEDLKPSSSPSASLPASATTQEQQVPSLQASKSAAASRMPSSKPSNRRSRGSSCVAEQGGRRSRIDSAAERDDAILPNAWRRSARLNHRHSDLPEYLKDPLSNLLPLDFFASTAQARRTSLTRHQGVGLGSSSGRRIDSRLSNLPARDPLSSLNYPDLNGASRVGVGGGGQASRPAILAVGRAHSVGDPSHQPQRSMGFPSLEARQEFKGEGGGLNNNNFQYQMTFLTPHPTTLAFEALNWASGTQDPMLLVQRDNRQVAAKGSEGPHSAAAGTDGEGGGGPGESAVGDASSSVAAVSQRLDESIDNDLEKNMPPGSSEPSGLQTSASEMPVPKPARVAKALGVRECVRILLSSPLYVCVTFSLCALFFEVTAIQFWSITYFQQLLKHSTGTVLIAFNITAATAPITGVLAGGWFIDFLGGYKDDRGMRRTMSVLLSWATACFFLGIGAGWTSNFWLVVVCMWFILFFGGGILPAATGIVIASVPLEVRAFGSGFCMMVFNVLGYVLGTFLPGLLIEAFSLLWGMRVIYLWSLNGVLGFALARWFLRRLEIQPAFVPEAEQLQWPRSAAAEDRSNSIKQGSRAGASALGR
ncbi:hypothetical protein Emag_003665 [Eimeria magna]